MKIWGVYLFHKTNMPRSIMVASLHWPSSITWRWLIWYSLPASGIDYPILSWYSGHSGWQVSVFSQLGNLEFRTQANMWLRETTGKKC